MTDRAATLRATLLVLLSALAFGAIPIFTLIARNDGAPLPSILAWRYMLAVLLLAPLAGGLSQLRLPRKRAWSLLVLTGGGQATIAFLALRALDYIPAATVAFLFYTYPAWVAVFGAVRRTEPLTPLRIGALLLSLTGIAVMIGAPGTAALHAAGVALALAAALAYALYIPLIGRLQGETPPAVVSVYVSLGAGIILLTGGVFSGDITLMLDVAAWGAIFGLALFSTAIAFILFLRALPVLGPVRTAIVSTVEPFYTAILGALILAQPLTGATLAGGALIAIAVILLQRREGVESASEPTRHEAVR